MDVRAYNRDAWNRQVADGNPWTIPVGPEVIAAAREGRWEVLLTPTKFVPRAWFPEMRGADVLGLACGGGQQGPIFAAAGARVTVFDNSPAQLAQDRLAAEREGLAITTVEGDMADLSAFADASFDLIFHPVSNVFAPDVRPVWREAYRVLRRGGALLAGYNNPAIYIFDLELADTKKVLRVKYTLPYSDVTSPSERKRRKYQRLGWPLEFSHSLEDQIGGQTDAGFLIAGLYEDGYPPEENDLLSKHMPIFIATRAIKP
ncbi:MAG: class I SAM-dependent methyltransferase [Chloroflexi bacterium]|nr:class I SAM-dependent methyltransferase [Chloroflexota bacterium]